MKKEYVKPYLALESFQLVAALAGSCTDQGYTPLNQSVDDCKGLESVGIPFFGGSCQMDVFENQELCYQTMIEGTGVTLTS